ncbi:MULTISPECIES: DUF982 domain-containing protein [unclassified Rhizobium]|uniref:DUF982 domain-containing protein n=1 Tax=unclassified Rhizobium TaxID=2613769 RepID=UPI0006475395|nr:MULTISPECIES: DUF982 domain-containing protein [unclassified Rhizobium]MBN8950076.1 DUF982 domain-containing protein [Rhizobium tropici]OJY62921.1 MAG: hypothetical protein BGP09_15815 [Rhizobium sp. 60-20]RKD74628.1 uncharacterized protein DUF982 [Rhizobium sp. WW_1]
MNTVLRFAPIRVIRSHSGETKSVGTADEVWKTLLDDWPSEEGDCFLSALLICIDVQRGERTPEEARVAFIAAAVEAGVPLLS